MIWKSQEPGAMMAFIEECKLYRLPGSLLDRQTVRNGIELGSGSNLRNKVPGKGAEEGREDTEKK
jgi:hypothetical protein